MGMGRCGERCPDPSNLVAGQRNQLVDVSPVCPLIPTAFGPSGGDEKRRGEHRQGDVAVPGVVGADLVMVQPGPILGELERFLDTSTGSGYPDQFGDRNRATGVADVVGQLSRLADRAVHQLQMLISPRIEHEPVVESQVGLLRLTVNSQKDPSVLHRNAPLSVEGRRRLVQRCRSARSRMSRPR